MKNNAAENVNVKDDRCRVMKTNYLMSEIEARDLGDIWYQSMNLLKEHFIEQIT